MEKSGKISESSRLETPGEESDSSTRPGTRFKAFIEIRGSHGRDRIVAFIRALENLSVRLFLRMALSQI